MIGPERVIRLPKAVYTALFNALEEPERWPHPNVRYSILLYTELCDGTDHKMKRLIFAPEAEADPL